MKVKFIFVGENVMRYLLMLFMIFISSNLQAYCYIINPESASNTKIEDVIEIKLDSRNVFEKEVSMVFPDSFSSSVVWEGLL